MNGRQFIYHMEGLTKTYPAGKKVLENIHLSFYPDAKIGVLGVNGSGKSTLLRIMAGIDTEYTGEGWVAEGARVGYLEQEPQLDPSKTVRENVMEGVAAKKALLDRYNEIASNYSDETADEMAKLQDQIDSKNLWDLDSQVDLAMDALRCPADDADIAKLSGVVGRAAERVVGEVEAGCRGSQRFWNRSDPAAWPSRRRSRPVVGRDLVVAVEQRLLGSDALHHVLAHGLARVELRLLLQVADAGAFRDPGLAGELVVDAGHDPQQRRLAGAVDADHADLGVRVERQLDVLQQLLGGRIGLRQTLHVVDELAIVHCGSNPFAVPNPPRAHHTADALSGNSTLM